MPKIRKGRAQNRLDILRTDRHPKERSPRAYTRRERRPIPTHSPTTGFEAMSIAPLVPIEEDPQHGSRDNAWDALDIPTPVRTSGYTQLFRSPREQPTQLESLPRYRARRERRESTPYARITSTTSKSNAHRSDGGDASHTSAKARSHRSIPFGWTTTLDEDCVRSVPNGSLRPYRIQVSYQLTRNLSLHNQVERTSGSCLHRYPCYATNPNIDHPTGGDQTHTWHSHPQQSPRRNKEVSFSPCLLSQI